MEERAAYLAAALALSWLTLGMLLPFMEYMTRITVITIAYLVSIAVITYVLRTKP